MCKILRYFTSSYYLPRHAIQGEGSALGGERETRFSEKKGREALKSAARPGWSNRSLTTRGVAGEDVGADVAGRSA